jgi:5-methylcytosine-specific restriction endonuclease McrA
MNAVAPPRREYHRQWHQKNKDKRNRQRMNLYWVNWLVAQTQAVAWSRANPGKVKLSQLKFRNPDGYREYNRLRMIKYRRENRAIVNSISQKRRAQKKATVIEMDSILEFMKLVHSKETFICEYCKNEFSSSKVHFDHRIPLCRGGEHRIENICASCPRCNLTKVKKLLSEWRPETFKEV